MAELPTEDESAPDEPRPGLYERFQRLILKSDAKETPNPLDEITSVDEAKLAIAHLNPTERVIGLFAAPLGGVVALLVTGSLIHNDPALPSPKHVAPSLYTELSLVTLGLCLVMLACAWFHKRLFLGIATALLGLSFFNLHFWGFGVPFIMMGAWYLVRTYRFSQKLKELEGDGGTSGGSSSSRAKPNKRFTPPNS